jgi:hypothetical protein
MDPSSRLRHRRLAHDDTQMRAALDVGNACVRLVRKNAGLELGRVKRLVSRADQNQQTIRGMSGLAQPPAFLFTIGALWPRYGASSRIPLASWPYSLPPKRRARPPPEE